MGAEQVIDYARVDVTAGDARYDLVLQLGGTYPPRAVRRVLTLSRRLVQSYGDGGRWLGPLPSIITAALLNPFIRQSVKAVTATVTTDSLEEITGLVESGHLAPVIGRTFPLADAGEAVALVEGGSPAGKVVVRVA